MQIIKVAEITKTLDFCPSQWEGKTKNGVPVYVRYRWGCLSVKMGGKIGVDGKEIFYQDLYRPFHGVMDYAELKQLTAGKIQWPEEEKLSPFLQRIREEEKEEECNKQ